jgi:hypothetical protein
MSELPPRPANSDIAASLNIAAPGDGRAPSLTHYEAPFHALVAIPDGRQIFFLCCLTHNSCLPFGKT